MPEPRMTVDGMWYVLSEPNGPSGTREGCVVYTGGRKDGGEVGRPGGLLYARSWRLGGDITQQMHRELLTVANGPYAGCSPLNAARSLILCRGHIARFTRRHHVGS